MSTEGWHDDEMRDIEWLDAEPEIQAPELGPCCACGATRRVRTVICLPQRGPTPGEGWGCHACGLPMDGAYAVLCDGCADSGAMPTHACAGRASDGRRVPVDELDPGPFEHDPSKHPEEGDRREHDPLCEGHADCPRCGPDRCCKPVVWGPVGEVVSAVCLECFEVIGVEDGP